MAVQQSQPLNGRTRGRPRDEEVRKRILGAALELLEAGGFGQVTVEAIAERAGASKATVYRWWRNNAAVIIEAFRDTVAPEVPFADTGSFRDDIRTQLQGFARVLSGRGGRIVTAVIAAARDDPEVAEAFRSIWSMPRRAEAKQMLRRSQRRGQLRKDVDLDLVLDAFYGPLYYRLLTKNEQPSQKYAEMLADLVLRGLVP